jgi:2'-5' RNA ligase
MVSDKKKSEHQYFIAIVPPEPVYSQAAQFKQYFKDYYSSKASLNSPPHITLHMPFRWKAAKEEQLIGALEKFAGAQRAFQITLNNFSCFEPRIIFIDVLKSDALDDLQKQLKRFCKQELNLFNADYKELAFHPHITLAFRDLKKAEFYKAWDEFKDKKVEATFRVDSIVLLKHDEKEWKEFNSLSLLAE